MLKILPPHFKYERNVSFLPFATPENTLPLLFNFSLNQAFILWLFPYNFSKFFFTNPLLSSFLVCPVYFSLCTYIFRKHRSTNAQFGNLLVSDIHSSALCECPNSSIYKTWVSFCRVTVTLTSVAYILPCGPQIYIEWMDTAIKMYHCLITEIYSKYQKKHTLFRSLIG